MAMQPQSVEIRSFQVGFGDCFLLSFIYGDSDKRHVLIDFGTTALARGGKPSVHMPKIAQEIAKVVGQGNRLTAVIATHRHADHISGFGTDNRTGGSGKVIGALRPRLVLQPWTEDPNAQPDASKASIAVSGTQKGFVASLASMNELADRVRKLADTNPHWMSAAVRKELSFLGADNIANKSAVDNLIAMSEQQGSKPRYLRYGDKTGLEKLLPGVKVRVLGPPDLTQTDVIRKQRSKDRDEFWHFVKGAVPRNFAQLTNGGAGRNTRVVPAQARWFRDRLVSLSGQGLLEIVRQLDQQMNNTSLILLFEVKGKKLLFPGDAQLENWSYALTEAEDSKEVCEMLAEVDFYKVGHHGSLNATPRKLLWEAFKKRKDRSLCTMLSTLSGKHGKRESKTEVPRRTLLSALVAESEHFNTQKLKSPTLELMKIY